MNKYIIGNIYKARVTSIQKYGIFASLDDEYSGLIHISELLNDYVSDINSLFKIGDIINVKIIDIKGRKNQLSLSAKNLNGDLKPVKKTKIKESIFGFYLLKKSLPLWIDKKMKEINKNL